MANETPKKRPAKPFRGVVDGVSFSKENQPDPELKKKGWAEWRKERNLTQAIIAELTGENKEKFKDYVTSLIDNAKAGNPKAIDAVNKCLEDDIIKVAQTDTEGNDLTDLSKLSNDELITLAELQRKSRISTS